MSQRRDPNRNGRRPPAGRSETSDLVHMKALAASARAGATPSIIPNAAELSGVRARRDSVVGLRVVGQASANSGVPPWLWGVVGCLGVVALGLGAFTYLNLPGLMLDSPPVRLATSLATSLAISPRAENAESIVAATGNKPPETPPPRIELIPSAAKPEPPAPEETAATEIRSRPPAARSPAAKSPAAKATKKLSKDGNQVDVMLSAALKDRDQAGAAAASATKTVEETPPTPTPASNDSTPTTSLSDVNAALDDLQPKLKQCFRRYQIPGIAKVKLVVSPTGAIEPSVISGDFEGTPTGDCVMKELSSATVPAFKGGPLNLSHAFVLR